MKIEGKIRHFFVVCNFFFQEMIGRPIVVVYRINKIMYTPTRILRDFVERFSVYTSKNDIRVWQNLEKIPGKIPENSGKNPNKFLNYGF